MLKSIINNVRGLAVLSVLFALVGAVLVAPGPAAAASCRPGGLGPEACVAVSVHVYDQMTLAPLNDAKVSLRDASGNVSYAYLVNDVGTYLAYVVPGDYKVTAYAPAHDTFQTVVMVQGPTSMYAPLMPNTFAPSGAPLSSTTAPTAGAANY